MRMIRYFIYGLTLAAVFASLFLPDAIGWKLIRASLFFGGLWPVLFPSDYVRWLQAARHDLRPLDPTLYWIPRLVGSGLMVLSLAMVLAHSK
jgi:hypothetical protein